MSGFWCGVFILAVLVLVMDSLGYYELLDDWRMWVYGECKCSIGLWVQCWVRGMTIMYDDYVDGPIQQVRFN